MVNQFLTSSLMLPSKLPGSSFFLILLAFFIDWALSINKKQKKSVSLLFKDDDVVLYCYSSLFFFTFTRTIGFIPLFFYYIHSYTYLT
jgi:hypothetical protein